MVLTTERNIFIFIAHTSVYIKRALNLGKSLFVVLFSVYDGRVQT